MATPELFYQENKKSQLKYMLLAKSNTGDVRRVYVELAIMCRNNKNYWLSLC